MTKKYKFLIVASTFYPKITEGLLNGAVTELKRLKFNYADSGMAINKLRVNEFSPKMGYLHSCCIITSATWSYSLEKISGFA